MDDLYKFIDDTCTKYNIDESHGLKHAKGTVIWAERLMAGLDDVGQDERNIIVYAAALHDMCDSKYRNIDDASDEITDWLRKRGWSADICFDLIRIITTMSYSKLKKARLAHDPVIYPNHGKWQRAYHIVRHADLLEAYRVVRCFLYSMRNHPDWLEDELWAETEKVFDERVFKYVTDGWIFLEPALAYIPELEAEARRCLKQRDKTYVVTA
jgi:hypothetical protein